MRRIDEQPVITLFQTGAAGVFTPVFADLNHLAARHTDFGLDAPGPTSKQRVAGSNPARLTRYSHSREAAAPCVASFACNRSSIFSAGSFVEDPVEATTLVSRYDVWLRLR
jgi:hypothetical protein